MFVDILHLDGSVVPCENVVIVFFISIHFLRSYIFNYHIETTKIAVLMPVFHAACGKTQWWSSGIVITVNMSNLSLGAVITGVATWGIWGTLRPKIM